MPPDDFDPLANLLELLDLRPADDEPDVYVGESLPQPHGRVFGGQVVAQGIIATGRTVAGVEGPPRHLHSLHGYFLRPGNPDIPIRYEVERLRDGNSFSARRVHAVQEGHPILSMIFSFQTAADGIDHQIEMPAVPDPETIKPDSEELLASGDAVSEYMARTRPVDLRHVQGDLHTRPRRQRSSDQSVWFRALDRLPDDELLHQAVIAYTSDYNILEAALRRHGLWWREPRLRPASLDHAMWFHRPVRADQWLLYTMTSPSAEGGRGLGMGHMFDEDGVLVVSVAQEGMLRLKES